MLPRYFKHNKLGSFSQQLHTYGFRRKANSSSLDYSIEFYHDQFSGDTDQFLAWIRSGGALSKRTASTRDPSNAPPPQLLQDLLAVQEGTRQLAQTFQQAKATHAMQLRTILMKLMLRGVLAPESVGYISSLAPQTPMLPVAPYPTSRAGGGGSGSSPSASWMDGAASLPAGGRCPSIEGLQAQLDALEAGLAPLSTLAAPMLGSQDANELHGDEALQLFAYSNAPIGSRSGEHRLPPYPVDAHVAMTSRDQLCPPGQPLMPQPQP